MSKRTHPSSYRLPPKVIERIDAIAAHLTEKRRSARPLNRTDVICHLVNTYRLPARSVEQPTTVETTKE